MAKKSLTLTEGTIWKSLVAFVIPILASSLFQQLYGAADTMIVGWLVGDGALAAIGATSVLNSMIIGLFLGISAGAGVIISQYYGAKDDDAVSRYSHTSIVFSLIGGLILTVGGVLLTPTFMRLMDCPEDVFDLSVIYLAIIFAGSIPNLLFNMGSGILRAVGESKRPLVYLGVSIVVNIVLDILMVGPMKLGIAGAAWATIISQAVAAALTLIRLMKTTDSCRIELRKLRFSRRELTHVMRVGLPIGLQSVALMFSNVLVQTFVNGYGSVVMAAYTAYNKLDNFLFMPLNAFGIAITTFVGQNIGANKMERAKKGVNICMGMAIGLAIVFPILIMLFSRPLLGLFSSSAEVLEYGVIMTNLIMPCYFMYAIIETMSGALKGGGYTLAAMSVTMVGSCVLRIIYLFIVNAAFHSLESLLFVYPVTWSLTSAAFAVIYRRIFYRKR